MRKVNRDKRGMGILIGAFVVLDTFHDWGNAHVYLEHLLRETERGCHGPCFFP